MANAKDGFDYMAKVFDKKAAAKFKRKIVVQFNIKGTGGGTWQVILENANYRIAEGAKEKPIVEMTYDSVESFVKVTKGEIDGIQAYTTGKLRFQGPQALLQEFGTVFPTGKAD